jgi:hypothetical protein
MNKVYIAFLIYTTKGWLSLLTQYQASASHDIGHSIVLDGQVAEPTAVAPQPSQTYTQLQILYFCQRLVKYEDDPFIVFQSRHQLCSEPRRPWFSQHQHYLFEND